MTDGPPPYETVQPATIGHLRLLQANGVALDIDGHRAFADGTEVILARKEYVLLRVLLENAGRVLTRRELLDAVWRPGYADHNKTLEVHVRRLRGKLGPARSRIRTVRGIGYVLDISPGQPAGDDGSLSAAAHPAGPAPPAPASTTSTCPAAPPTPAPPQPGPSGDS